VDSVTLVGLDGGINDKYAAIGIAQETADRNCRQAYLIISCPGRRPQQKGGGRARENTATGGVYQFQPLLTPLPPVQPLHFFEEVFEQEQTEVTEVGE
jgi:hypothetical protein